jgi:hypothetical protein
MSRCARCACWAGRLRRSDEEAVIEIAQTRLGPYAGKKMRNQSLRFHGSRDYLFLGASTVQERLAG